MNELIIEHKSFTHKDLTQIDQVFLNNYPIVYMLYNPSKSGQNKRKTAYIGQTVNVNQRMKNHLESGKRQNLTDTLLIGHEKFNQSATYNIETNLINYLIADEEYKLQNVSQTRQKYMHGYYKKALYDQEIFSQIWQVLLDNHLVKHSLSEIENKDIFKISPYKALSSEQLALKEEIIDYCTQNIDKNNQHIFIIEGEAGTGKSVLLSSLFNTIQDLSKDASSPLYKTDNYLLVNHTEMQKTYHSIAEALPNLTKSRFEKPTSFINKYTGRQADIVLVDEGHLLLSTQDKFNNFSYDNQLEEIIKRAKVTIFIYDSKQFLKFKSFWDDDQLTRIVSDYDTERKQLKRQFRMQAPIEVEEWIDNFVRKQVTPLPKNAKSKSFELKIMASPDELKDYIREANNIAGLARIVSTFDYLHKKDGGIYYVDPEGLNLPWNTTGSPKTWAERPETIHEVGSIYTVQGFDLNYVGLVLGPSIDFDDERNELIIDTSLYKDTGAFTGTNRFNDQETIEHTKEQIILNSINVLMKRGVHGLALYAVNPRLRQRLLSLQERNK
ncbi:DUF2075 domain-containing protein [Hutsoniella sourekii]